LPSAALNLLCLFSELAELKLGLVHAPHTLTACCNRVDILYWEARCISSGAG